MSKHKVNEPFWTPGSQFKCDPIKASKEFDKLRAADPEGDLIPEAIVKRAESPRSVLHKEFIWDDEEAAYEHRLTVARKMMRSIKVIREEAPETPMRMYEVVRVPATENRPKARKVYRTMEEIMADPDSRAALLHRALDELMAIRKKYHLLQELAIIFREVEAVYGEFDEVS